MAGDPIDTARLAGQIVGEVVLLAVGKAVDVVTEVSFHLAAATRFGWDDAPDPPHKLLPKGASDTLLVRFDPAVAAPLVRFESSDTTAVTVTWSHTAPGVVELALTAPAAGSTHAVVQALVGGASLATIAVESCPWKSRTVSVRPIRRTGSRVVRTVDHAALERFLHRVFDQAVIAWTYTSLPELDVPYDLNGDGEFDVSSWMSPEMTAVRAAADDPARDYNIFIVEVPTDDAFGRAVMPNRHAFVHQENTATPTKTLSHELGHCMDLDHENDDSTNVMCQGEGEHMWRLRKHQWDKLRALIP